ncbi:AhpA/YtjB family protein [Alishewanella sp. HH-ZS]|uniref:AhpA/YtjB family protein n=1 Tax=Alishewanella sp. HH-ZS TaxID=1856684 RepID=UPI0021013026|nr:AhpA/YtjB family protein [Alishewanella sp. HH-ZS]
MSLRNMQHHSLSANPSSSVITLLQLALAVLGIWFILHSWSSARAEGQQVLQQQNQLLMRETLSALSHTAGYLLENDQLEGLQQLTQHIAENPFLHDVVVYDANGVRLSWSEANTPARLLYSPDQALPLIPMVEEIRVNQQLLGYIKVSLLHDKNLFPGYDFWQQLMQQMLGLFLLTAAIGMLLKRSFYRLISRYRKLPVKQQT